MNGFGANGKYKRLIQVTAGNIAHSHLSIAGHSDFFPEDAFGPSSCRQGSGNPIYLDLDGLDKRIETDIPVEGESRRVRKFRDRTWARDFFKHHDVKPGDWVSLERRGERVYRVALASDPNEPASRQFLEFFAGIGLVRVGLERSGWSIAYANDIDPDKRDMYDAHFGDANQHYEVGDIHALDVDAIPDAQLATASFPCTDLSLAGGRDGLNGKGSSAFFGFVSILEQMNQRRPPFVLLENVLGFLNSHGGQDFRTAMLALNRLGYAVDPFVLDAKWFVPQSRPRLFVLGKPVTTRRESENWRLAPAPTRMRPASLLQFVLSNPDIDWDLAELPEPPAHSDKQLEQVLENLPADAPEWWSRERTEYLYNQMSPKHRETADCWMAKPRWSHGTVFRRVRRQPDGKKRSMAELRSDGIAGCLRTPKGGSGRQIVFRAGYGRYAARLLTPRECARLMGADDFQIDAPLNQALFGFGDAVCVPAISWIADHYLHPLVDSITATALAGA